MQERELSQKDEKSFKEYFAKLVEENNVVPALWLMQDEFKAISEKKLKEIKRRCWLMLCLLSASNLVHHLAQRLSPEAPCVSVLDFGTPI